jgi:8-oxo-dGTP diphosphatase/2-hydroxy-dATP diphosphatase
MKQLTTLVLHCRPGEVLLGMKKRGFGAGKWNGFGGKVKPGEDIEAAARRELQEECGLTAESLTKAAEIVFTFANDPLVIDMHVFVCDRAQGEPTESDEMRPQWFAQGELPSPMWADDPLWMSRVLAGERLRGRVHFQDYETVLSHEFGPL